MAPPKLSESDMRMALEAVALHGSISKAAAALGMPRETLQARVTQARARFEHAAIRVDSHQARVGVQIEHGDVIVFSDAHYWPGEATTAHKALIGAIKEFRPRIVIANGDVFDGASISRHARIGWDRAPSVKEELEAVTERLAEVEQAAGSAQLIWPLGNHDARYETFLAANAPQYEGVQGFSLKDKFPRWMPCWRSDINAGMDSHTIVKHRWHSGVHGAWNNTLKAGTSIATGHTHRLHIREYADARGLRYGIETGTLLELQNEQCVDYTEDGVLNWQPGFVILHYRNGRMLRPEQVQVVAPGLVEFRGREYSV